MSPWPADPAWVWVDGRRPQGDAPPELETVLPTSGPRGALAGIWRHRRLLVLSAELASVRLSPPAPVRTRSSNDADPAQGWEADGYAVDGATILSGRARRLQPVPTALLSRTVQSALDPVARRHGAAGAVLYFVAALGRMPVRTLPDAWYVVTEPRWVTVARTDGRRWTHLRQRRWDGGDIRQLDGLLAQELEDAVEAGGPSGSSPRDVPVLVIGPAVRWFPARLASLPVRYWALQPAWRPTA